MEQDWPKEPWDYVKFGEGHELIHAGTGEDWERVVGLDTEDDAATLIRIAACVNVCAGIPNLILKYFEGQGETFIFQKDSEMPVRITIIGRDNIVTKYDGPKISEDQLSKVKFQADNLIMDGVHDLYRQAAEKYGIAAYQMFRPVIEWPKLGWNDEPPTSVIVRLELRDKVGDGGKDIAMEDKMVICNLCKREAVYAGKFLGKLWAYCPYCRGRFSVEPSKEK